MNNADKTKTTITGTVESIEEKWNAVLNEVTYCLTVESEEHGTIITNKLCASVFPVLEDGVEGLQIYLTGNDRGCDFFVKSIRKVD